MIVLFLLCFYMVVELQMISRQHELVPHSLWLRLEQVGKADRHWQ